MTMTLKGLLSKAKLCDLTVGLNWIKAVTNSGAAASFLLKARRKRVGINIVQTKPRITDKGGKYLVISPTGRGRTSRHGVPTDANYGTSLMLLLGPVVVQ